MSLNAEQRKQTSIELKANYEISGLTPEEIEADLGFNHKKLEDALNLNSSTDGEAVWRFHDYTEEKIKEQRGEPYLYPYSVPITNI